MHGTILAMNKSNAKTYIWVIVISTIAIWAAVLLVFEIELTGSVEALKKLPLVVTIEAGIWLVFTQWAWKQNIFQSWLVAEPIVQGTWKGTLKSTWVNPETGVAPDPIPIVFSIKQDFYNISCSIYTQESSSHSYFGRIYIDESSDVKRFIYTYTNKPKASVRHRSEYHDGTANLRIIGGSQNKMEGDYWTTRKSTGDIEVEFVQKKLVSSFSEVE
jgi:hypothetical protein